MTYYCDITLLPDTEFPATVLMNAVYAKLHKCLFDIRSNSVGVSFPNAGATLGAVLRLHGTEERLRELSSGQWLGGMLGYCRLSQLAPAPVTAKHRVVRRTQPRMSESKLKRLLKRGSITPAEVENYRVKQSKQTLAAPYLELVSQSNGQKHRRFIAFGDIQAVPVAGEFDSFGLSKTATVPWF